MICIRHQVRRILPLLAGIGFLVVALGMTCDQYLELDPSGVTDQEINILLFGDPPLPLPVTFQGYIEYQAGYKGYRNPQGELRCGACWSVNKFEGWIAVFEPWNLPSGLLVTVTDDLWYYDPAAEDWEKRHSSLVPSEECPQYLGNPANWDFDQYEWGCAQHTLSCCGSGQAPFGDYEMTVIPDGGEGICPGPLEFCRKTFRHTVPVGAEPPC